MLRWAYYHFHLPVLFGFMALARLLRAERYPYLRTAFVLSHIPALMVIALYPLLPPRWVPGMPFSVPAPEELNGAMHNATAAAASQHVGYPIFIAAAHRLADEPRALVVAHVPLPGGRVHDRPRDGEPLHARRDHRRSLHRLRLRDGAAACTARSRRSSTSCGRALGPSLLAALGYAFVVRAIDTASALTLPPQPASARRTWC